MLDYYYIIEPFEELKSLEESMASYLLNKAIDSHLKLYVCVQSLQSCTQILSRFFGDDHANKLRKRKPVLINGVNTLLETTSTLKNTYKPEPALYFAMYPSSKMLYELENNEFSGELIVFGEAHGHEHLRDWVSEHKAIQVTVEPLKN